MKYDFTTSRSALILSALLALAPRAHAADWYVSPSGTGTTAAACGTRAATCSLTSAASTAVAGDTVYLMDGVYSQSITVANTGTAAAPITFKADTCATPIIESATATFDDQSTGVYSEVGEYLHFEGLVVRGWGSGFSNGWAGGTDSDAVSNGHWQIKNCIAYSNGRTGFTFFSAPDFQLTNSISAHNGTSTVHSWSSGVTLFEGTGTLLVQGVLSFENTDEQKHTDGSGFIVDQSTNGAVFSNDIAFGNSGSCFRMTLSSGTTFVNNTCYHNSQFGSQATGPTNPSELYFTNGGVTIQNVNFTNNIIVGTGTAPAGSQTVQNKPTTGWANNVDVLGAATFLNAPDGMNPDFTPAASATSVIGKGAAGAAVPTTDIGFDPKCLVKQTPKMYGSVPSLSRWQYDVDIAYVASKGGVVGCFNAGTRATPPDVGAYKSGAVSVAQGCTPTPPPPPTDNGGTGGVASASGGASTGGASGAGTTTTGGTATVPSGGSGGTTSSAGATTAGAGAPGPGNAGSGASATGNAPSGDSGGSGSNDSSGCGCRTAPRDVSSGSWTALALFALATVGLKRRRVARS